MGSEFWSSELNETPAPEQSTFDIRGAACRVCKFSFGTVDYASRMTDEAHSPLESNDPKESDGRLNRPLGDEEFKSKLEMTKAFCDTAKIYVQISSAGLAVPLLLSLRSSTGIIGYLFGQAHI